MYNNKVMLNGMVDRRKRTLCYNSTRLEFYRRNQR